MIIHSNRGWPRIKTIPVYKKPVTSSFSHELYLYYNKKRVFIHDKYKNQLITGFKNVIVLFINEDKNENSLLFSLACNPDWNDNKDINYSIITSEATIRKVREICNALYELSSKDTTREPVILVDRQVLAYAMRYPEFFYYKLVKSKNRISWKKDGKMKLYNRNTKEKAKYEQMEQYINDRYYVIGDQKVEIEGKGEDQQLLLSVQICIFIT